MKAPGNDTPQGRPQGASQGTSQATAADAANLPVTPAIAAEAAVWIARLHGPSRSPKMEREFRAWQARSAAHRTAFERTTDVWEAVPRIRLQDAYASASSRAARSAGHAAGGGYQGKGARRRWPLLALVPVMVVAAALLVRYSVTGDSYATAVGEQHLVVLADGSRMTLNTNTKVRVSLGASQRSVEVQQGEALFEVAKDARRPFVVHAGGTDVVAVGTVFSVKLGEEGSRAADALDVTLVEGQISVRPDPSAWSTGVSPERAVLMNAGQRMRLVKTVAAKKELVDQELDRPRMDRLFAWKRSEADFDDVPLSDAVAEMNRYSRTPITLVGDDALARLRISGLYHTGDNASFAKAVSALHGLTLQEREGRLELSLPH